MVGCCVRFCDEVWEERHFGRLDPALRGEVEEHLAECTRCRRQCQQVVDEIAFLRSVLEVWQRGGWERRGSVRVAVQGGVTLVIGRARKTAKRVEAQLRDESRTGLGLVCRRKLRPGQRVTAVRGAASYAARVRWCRAFRQSYYVGLELLVT